MDINKELEDIQKEASSISPRIAKEIGHVRAEIDKEADVIVVQSATGIHLCMYRRRRGSR